MAKAPDPSAVARHKAREAAELEPAILVVDGREYLFDPQDLTATRERVIWDATGLGVDEILAAAAPTNGDGPRRVRLDMFAALIWLARDAAGDNITIQEVRDSVNPVSLTKIMADTEAAEKARKALAKKPPGHAKKKAGPKRPPA